jgi:hypothetical protein
MILRDPIATLDSMHHRLFSDIPLRMHFEGLLSSYRILFDLCWVLPRSRLVLYERLGEDVFKHDIRLVGSEVDQCRSDYF